MKRFWLVALLLVLIAAPSTASSLGFGVGYLDTEGAADDNGAALKLSLDAGKHWNMDARASFFDGHALVVGERTFSIEATPVELGLSYGFNPGSKASFYVGAGINYTFYKSEVFNTFRSEFEQSDVADEPGWYAVAGVEGSLKGSVGLFAEALYRQNKPSVDGDGLAELGSLPVDFAGFGAAVGLSYNW